MNRENGLIIEGYASVFERPYLMKKVREPAACQEWEIIDRDAFRYCDFSQARLLIDHEKRRETMATVQAGTLEVNADWYGLHFLADLAATQAGRALYEDIYQGFIFRVSMGFNPNKAADEFTWSKDEKTSEKIQLRRIKEILFLKEISPLSPHENPANPETCVFPLTGLQWAIRTRELEKLQKAARIRQKLRGMIEHGEQP